MPRELILDPSTLDAEPIMTTEQIQEINPHRFEFQLLTAVTRIDRENQIVAGYLQNTPEDFWVRGHIPGRPLMPGVLMIESSAQLSSLAYHVLADITHDRFIGFGGVDGVKFRGTVGPEDRFWVVVKAIEMRSRRAKFDAQGIVNGKLVYEGVITGMPV